MHTVSVESEGEQVEVLRVAVYEEEWMGPCNMKSIRYVRVVPYYLLSILIFFFLLWTLKKSVN